MNGWHKAAATAGALAFLGFVGGAVATGVAVAFAASEYMTSLEDRIMSALGALVITLMVVAGALFLVGEIRDDFAGRRRDER